MIHTSLARPIGKQSPLSIKNRVVIKDWSPLCILLLRRKKYAIIDMERVDNIRIVDGIITNRSPTTFLGAVDAATTSSGRTRLNDDDLFGAGGTNGIYQVLEAHNSRTVYGTATGHT